MHLPFRESFSDAASPVPRLLPPSEPSSSEVLRVSLRSTTCTLVRVTVVPTNDSCAEVSAVCCPRRTSASPWNPASWGTTHRRPASALPRSNSASHGTPFHDSERCWRLIHPGLLREVISCDRPYPRGDWPPLHPPGRGSSGSDARGAPPTNIPPYGQTGLPQARFPAASTTVTRQYDPWNGAKPNSASVIGTLGSPVRTSPLCHRSPPPVSEIA